MISFHCVLLLGVLCGVVRGDYLEQRKVVYMDRSKPESGINNYIFRGNEPKISQNGVDVFAYDLLASYLANASLSQAGVTLPSKFYLIDIKYVYSTEDPAETADIAMETAFFKLNPTLGQFSTHLIWGDVDDPTVMPVSKVETMAKNLSAWQHDNLPVYIPSLYELLYTKESLPTVIYFHCECGCDRTGEVAASYALKYMNMTFPQATSWDQKIAGRAILPNHQFAMHWYCYYLSVVEGMSLQCQVF